jgi:hypothetical protein
MYRKEVNSTSPLRVLDQSIHGGLGCGNLGVVIARAGVGKTAVLVQIALDDAMRQRPVLHIAIDQDLGRLFSWYESLLRDLAQVTQLDDADLVLRDIAKHRVLHTLPSHRFSATHVGEVVASYKKSLDFVPRTLIIEGFDWEGPDVRATLTGLRELARSLDVELWMSARTHRELLPDVVRGLVPPCDAYAALIDVALYLQPKGKVSSLCILKDHDTGSPAGTDIDLNPDAMRLITGNTAVGGPILNPSMYTLVSGGCVGAETAFGEQAEKWGVDEVNYSFSGRRTERTRGVVELSDEELNQGDVSRRYVATQLRRQLPSTAMFQKIMQTIWFQVTTCNQIFAVGELQDDGSVTGGTGWAVELARHFNKPCHVFDQNKNAWHAWDGTGWKRTITPRILHTRFAGVGTRFLTDRGRAAIADLFEEAFGD